MHLEVLSLFWLISIVLSHTIHDIHLGRELNQKIAFSSQYNLLSFNHEEPPVLPEDSDERSSEFWIDMAQEYLSKRINHMRNTYKANNIILFVGDGMSIATLTAARIYKGQMEGRTGEESKLSFDDFPYVGLSKTYCANGQVPDSACTATAYLCGVKANFLTVGVNAKVGSNKCEESENPANQVDSIAKWAKDAGKAVGLVTTTTVTHASPAAAYAHVANRGLESDADLVERNVTGCTDIAKQLITKSPGKDFNVIFGGGRGKFRSSAIDPKGERLDGVDLIKFWQLNNPRGQVVTTREELLALRYKMPSKVLGLFGASHMKFNMLADSQQPSLTEMTEAAIRILNRERQGYFLFVEGGRIDHGHHATKARLALDETLELAKAVERARQITSEDDTLIVVTADHSHTMTISGYPSRGNDILGLNNLKSDKDELPYTTLSYANGPSKYVDQTGKRIDLKGKLSAFSDYPAGVEMSVETHGGDDVAVFASGPYAHLFTGLYEQHFLPHIMAYAGCIGKGKTVCN